MMPSSPSFTEMHVDRMPLFNERIKLSLNEKNGQHISHDCLKVRFNFMHQTQTVAN